MPRSIAGSSLSRYASTDFESQPDPAFEGVNTDDLSTLEIHAEIEKLNEETRAIQNEIRLFTEYCDKFGVPEIVTEPEDTTRNSRRKKRQNQEKKPERLQIQQKIDIINKLHDSVAKEKHAIQIEHAKREEEYADELEQLGEQMKEIQRLRLEFERDIGKESQKKGSGDKFLRFHKSFVDQADGSIGKLKLKKANMKDQLKRVNLNLKQKEEQGDTLLEVDFNQLRIENQQFLERIDQKNQELLLAKLKAGKIHALLAQKQAELHEAALKQETLMKRIKEIEDFNQSNTEQYEVVKGELETAKSHRDEKQNLISSYQVPTVFDYVQQTAKTQQLEHDIKEWSRKVQIIEQENLMLKKQFSRLQ